MLSIVLIVGGLAAVIAGISASIYYSLQARKQRTNALRAVAQRLEMSFQEEPSLGIIPDAKRFELFSQGTGREVRNHMSVVRDGRTVSVFDYTYMINAGKSHVPHRQTVVHVHAPGLSLPAFTLRPENALHRLGSFFGYQDIDVEGDPAFSDAYLLRGVEEELIRACFAAPVREFYAAHPETCTEGNGAELILWRDGKVLSSEEIQPFMESAYVLLGRFLNHSPARPPLAG